MVLEQMVVDAVLLEGRSLREVAAAFGVSKSFVDKKVAAFRRDGAAGLVRAPRTPRTNPNQMSAAIEDRVVALRKELNDLGADCGASTIRYHYGERHGDPPSTSAIYRALKRRGFVVPSPAKRPRSSYVRFEAAVPNECWQGDMTHYQLSDGTGVEILNFIDDYSRMVVACEVLEVTKANDVR
jgi:transposase